MLIRIIRDPEHPYTLSQLRVVSPKLVKFLSASSTLLVQFKPTVPTCSLTSLIGLCIRERILQNFVVDPAWKLLVISVEGSHEKSEEINKQLCDKERVAAAMENENVVLLIRNCIEDRYGQTQTSMHV